jgi:hypothetical protein
MYDADAQVVYTTTEEYQACLLRVFAVADMDQLHTAISALCAEVDLTEELNKLHYDMPTEMLHMLLFSYDNFKATHEAIATMRRTPRSCSHR